VTGFTREWAAAALAVALLAGSAEAQRSAEDSIYPLSEYRAADARALAVAHGGELRALYEAVRRCAPELDFARHGIGFRRPLGMTGIDPYFTAWTWLQWAPPPEGLDLVGRAADAFRRYGPKLLPHLAARDPVRADAKVGGYGLVLTWLKPGPTTDAPVGETLVVFAPKESVVSFVSGGVTLAELVARSRLRLFDGQTEMPLPSLGVPDRDAATPASPPC
jgi:hypothetical protein